MDTTTEPPALQQRSVTPEEQERPALDSVLADLLAAAAPFTDRADAHYFRPIASRRIRNTGERVGRWLRAAAGDDLAARALMDRRAETGRELGAGLRDVELRDHRHLPQWAIALVTFVRAQPMTPDDAAGSLIGGPFVSFRLAAQDLINWEPTGLAGIEMTDSGRDELLEQLATRLAAVCDGALRFELQVDGRGDDWRSFPGIDVSRSGWIARFTALPGLAYVVGVACEQWATATVELFDRLRSDLPALRRSLWNWAEVGALEHFSGDAGDRHDDGRSVALLEFSSGHGVVYKPKDLQHAVAFMDLSTFLNGRGLSLDLPTRTIVPRDGYGWEQRVQPRPCPDEEGFARFYRRLGMLIRLAQFLEGRDLWADNLLAVGEYPVLADLECLLYPRGRFSQRVDGAPSQQMVDALEDTVIRTAMAVQPWQARDGEPILDVGCLSRAGDPASWPAGCTVAPLPLPRYLPWLTTEGVDHIANPHEHLDGVVAGYREMHRTLLSGQRELGDPSGPLGSYRGAWVRYIWRNTHDCLRALRASVSPLALVDGVTRETVLAGILRGAFQRSERMDLPEIVEAELRAFRRLDVPMFRSLTTSSSAFAIDGTEIAEHFNGTAWQQLLARIDGLPRFDLDGQVGVLQACLDCAVDAAERPLPVPPRLASPRVHRPGTNDTVPGTEELLTAASEIADLVLRARTQESSGGRGWIGAYFRPASGLRGVDLLSVDLLYGTSGIAVFLAELAALTGNPRHWSGASEILDGLKDLVAATGGSSPTDGLMTGGFAVPGGLAGPGGIAYALARAGAAIGDTAAIASSALAAGVATGLSRTAPRPAHDVPFGTAGVVLDLLQVRRHTGHLVSRSSTEQPISIDDAITELCRTLVVTLTDTAGEAGTDRVDPLAAFLPTGRDSIVMTLARAIQAGADLVPNATEVRELLRQHVFDISTAGGRLAGLDAVAVCGTVVGRPEPSTPGTAGSRTLVRTINEAVVRGAPDLAAGEVRELLARRAAAGSWFPDRRLPDRHNFSVLDGVIGVGNLLLALVDPGIGLPQLLS